MTFDRTLILSLCALTLLGACENAKKELGLERSSPDEFAVVKRAPLAMPPDFALRAPEPGAPRPQEQSTAAQARTAVLGAEGDEDAAPAKGAASGESALLQEANAANYPNIRKVVDSESKVTTSKNTPVVKKLLNIGKKDAGPAKVVNPTAEAQRLKKNAEEGKPVTEGETPAVEE